MEVLEADFIGPVKPIITSCNDIKIINTQTLASAIDQSSGVLKLLVVTGKDGQTKPIRVTMKPLVSSRF